MSPFISICIPAYKNTKYLKVLFESIESQTFKDYEVIVTDDSPSNEVMLICNEFKNKFSLVYKKNIPALGSPKNWNEGMKMANGEWIKIMHDDDWFSSSTSLEQFAIIAKNSKNIDFFFSAFTNCSIDGLQKKQIPNKWIQNKLKKSPLILFRKNYIGHPSTTLIKNNLYLNFDEKLKWVVDFEFYIRILKQSNFGIIHNSLVNIGINEDQITKKVFRDINVEIPENIYLINKLGEDILSKIYVYDYYWRVFRNLSIRSLDEVKCRSRELVIPIELIKMMRFQFKFPLKLIRLGAFSKILMMISYLKFRINRN